MIVETREAQPADSAAMTDILNATIAAGGTTAHQTAFEPDRLLRHYIQSTSIISCSVAEVQGQISGFQALLWPDTEGQPYAPGWAIIATFVGEATRGAGAGRALFARTLQEARTAKVAAIDATIRADNTGGLRYYERMEFVDYDVLRNVPLRDGTLVDRVRKRYDL